LSQKIAGVKVHFMLAPDKNNRKAANWGHDMTSTWKWNDIAQAVKHADRAAPKKVVHVDATTDANGEAEKELTLSRFGGDVFTPGCYVSADPHLGKYVPGYAKLEKRVPKLAAKAIKVFRKFWYQPIEVTGVANPGAAGAVAKWADARAEMVQATKLTVSKADAKTYKAIYPRYMVKVNGGNADALVVTDSNKANFFTGAVAEASKPVKIPLIICDAQWDSGGSSGAEAIPYTLSTAFPVDKRMDKLTCDPPVQGGKLLVSGTWVSQKRNPADTAWVAHKNGSLKDGDVTIDSGRTNIRNVRIALPADAGSKAVIETGSAPCASSSPHSDSS
jgi:hypothetical protein